MGNSIGRPADVEPSPLPSATDSVKKMIANDHSPSCFRISIDSAVKSIIDTVFENTITCIHRIPSLETVVAHEGTVVCEFDGLYFLPQRNLLVAAKSSYELTETIMESVKSETRRLAHLLAASSGPNLEQAETHVDKDKNAERCLSRGMQDAALLYLLNSQSETDIEVIYCICFKINSLDDRYNDQDTIVVSSTCSIEDGYNCALRMTRIDESSDEISSTGSSELIADDFLKM